MEQNLNINNKKMPRVAKLRYPPKRLKKLEKTKWRQPKLWEIFTFLLKKWEYMFGRVVHTEPVYWINNGKNPNIDLLVYIYGYKQDNYENIPELKKEDMIWATIAWREIWQWWYFKTIKQGEIKEEDVYHPICCFNSWLYFYDEEGNKLDSPTCPCIEYGLPNIHWVEISILEFLWERPIPERLRDKERYIPWRCNDIWFRERVKKTLKFDSEKKE